MFPTFAKNVKVGLLPWANNVRCELPNRQRLKPAHKRSLLARLKDVP
jgi:hypothetical protein